MDEGAWEAAVHGVAKSWTRLSDFTFTFHFHALEKEMASHSSILAWRIPGTREPGGLPSMGSHRVRHDWSDLAAAAKEGRGCTDKRGSSQERIVQPWSRVLVAPQWTRITVSLNGNPLQYSCLENPMDGGACWATIHGVTKSQTRLSNFTLSSL